MFHLKSNDRDELMDQLDKIVIRPNGEIIDMNDHTMGKKNMEGNAMENHTTDNGNIINLEDARKESMKALGKNEDDMEMDELENIGYELQDQECVPAEIK